MLERLATDLTASYFISGDVVLVEYELGTDDTPVVAAGTSCLFIGFRIGPE